MNTCCFSLNFYLILVFLQGAIFGAMAYRNHKKMSWRLKLLRKIYANFDTTEDLLKLTDRRHSEKYSANPDHKAKMYYESISDHHLPVVECANKEDQVLCPTPAIGKQYYCISRTSLCDRKINCPYGEDENLVACMFYKSIDMTVKELYHALLKHEDTS